MKWDGMMMKVRKKESGGVYAMKVIKKKDIKWYRMIK